MQCGVHRFNEYKWNLFYYSNSTTSSCAFYDSNCMIYIIGIQIGHFSFSNFFNFCLIKLCDTFFFRIARTSIQSSCFF